MTTRNLSADPPEASRFDSARGFRRAIWLLAGFYAVIQAAYVSRLPVIMDEFAGEYEAGRLTSALPYRDFTPYKTVLGYYVQAIPSLFFHEAWTLLMAIKWEIVLVNTAMLIAAAFYLSRSVRRSSVVTALALLICCTSFLERSSELRVDMLTAWVGLWSLLVLLRGRYALAGALCALSFLVSQKGSFYFVAGNGAILFFMIAIDRSRTEFGHLMRFNAAAAAVMGAYLAFWSLVSSPQTVFGAVFQAASGVVTRNRYDIRSYWRPVLERNPVVFLLTAAVLVAMVIAIRRLSRAEIHIAAYSVAILVQAIWYPQPWPYFFVLLFPTLWVLHAVGFERVREMFSALPSRSQRLLAVALMVFGVIYPLTRVPMVLTRDNSYQRYNVRLAESMLSSGGGYLAGVRLLPGREHIPEQLSWLDRTALLALRDAPAASHRNLVDELRRHPPRLVIGNYRIDRLPPTLLQHLQQNYSRLTGSIYGYAPLLPPGRIRAAIAFGGTYLIDSRNRVAVDVDGQRYPGGATVVLRAGPHEISSAEPLRLRLMPDAIEQRIDPRYHREQDFFPDVYGF